MLLYNYDLLIKIFDLPEIISFIKQHRRRQYLGVNKTIKIIHLLEFFKYVILSFFCISIFLDLKTGKAFLNC